ncbi:MAG: hypothetical protein ACLQGP_42165, partial [Isosphaeraceae bacterium]
MAVNTAREATNGTGPPREPDAARRAKPIVVLALVALVGAGSWVVLTAHRSGVAARPSKGVRLLTLERPFPAEGRYASDPYIGPKVCAECHPAQSALHVRSGHGQTLSPASRRKLSRELDGKTVADPEQPDVLWSYDYRNGQLHIARKAGNK